MGRLDIESMVGRLLQLSLLQALLVGAQSPRLSSWLDFESMSWLLRIWHDLLVGAPSPFPSSWLPGRTSASLFSIGLWYFPFYSFCRLPELGQLADVVVVSDTRFLPDALGGAPSGKSIVVFPYRPRYRSGSHSFEVRFESPFCRPPTFSHAAGDYKTRNTHWPSRGEEERCILRVCRSV